MMVLFTHGDSLEEDMTIEKYTERVKGANLQQLINECSSRYQVFNNRDKSNCTQAIELINKMEDMVETNGGSCYTKNTYRNAPFSKNAKLQNKREDLMVLLHNLIDI
ncbi:UNVERIFIED_CONTAM: hypothetical protein FKN15_047920 [Acipenser sinensis]